MAYTGERYWRIRIKYGAEESLAREAWARNEVGIWYGGWSAGDWRLAVQQSDPVAFLSDVHGQKELGWRVPKSFFDTARRFVEIGDRNWVVVFFDDSLHLARVLPDLVSHPEHPLNRRGELFKFRGITSKKRFRLSRLPDSYRLIPPAGRGNVHQFNDEATRALVKILADSTDEDTAVKAIHALPAMEWLELLGPVAWESFCLGFLILEEGFLPTGLAVGRTLPAVDIVGRDRSGKRVFASCKKNPDPIAVPPEFVKTCQNIGPDGRFFLFAYGGCFDAPERIMVVTRVDLEAWARTEAGSRYLAMWR